MLKLVKLSSEQSPSYFFGGLIYLICSLQSSSSFEFQTESPLHLYSRLAPSAGLQESLLSENFTSMAVEARSNRVRRGDMFYFPTGSSLTLQFKLKSDIYSSTSTTWSIDQRFELKFKLPTRSKRKRRSLSDERMNIYSSLVKMMDRTGVDGHQCLLRAVCEASERPLEEYGLVGEVMGLLLGPGHTGVHQYTNSSLNSIYEDPNPDDDFYGNAYGLSEFIQAEDYGRKLGGCWTKYSRCRVPMRTIVYNAIHTLSQNNHLLYHDEL